MKNEKAITLVALVVTIAVLIIITGVTINLTIREEGLLDKTKDMKTDIETIMNEQEEDVEELNEQMKKNIQMLSNNRPNPPVLLTGMTPIKFTMPTENQMGTVVKTQASDTDWYQYGLTYETRRWANAQTKDGSMWVWIPRYAYKITYYTDSSKNAVSNTKTKYGTIDVVFLSGTTDNYYDENGEIKTAQRQRTAEETIDTTTNYTVHPAFTDESSINFANGGWDSELTGIWVAKFEAGHASGNNSAPVVATDYTYTQTKSWVIGVERPRNADGTTKSDGSEDARNWLDGIYGSKVTSIKYPTFQGTTYAMNYINHNDCFNVSKSLTESGNIYGLNSANTDSHLMKNSEWGAVIYLSQSIYGQNGTEIKVNNATLGSGGKTRTETAGKSGVDSVYAITGCTSNQVTWGQVMTTIEKIKAVTGNTPTTDTIYTWNQKNGQNGSTTGTMYGIYDMSGGSRERTAAYVANGNANIERYGKAFTHDENNQLRTTSTKYATVYPYSSSEANEMTTTSRTNFLTNTKIYGDAIRETTSSNAGTANTDWNKSSWNNDRSEYPGYSSPFFLRGECWYSGEMAGGFAFYYNNGSDYSGYSFRTVLVAK